MPDHPLEEVFGFPITNLSATASRYRRNKLCPFNNRVPNCTKDKANDPLGVCSIFDNDEVVITCPIRFRQDWLVADDAANFLFPSGTTWTSLTEVRLNDRHGKTAGNIDVVLVSYDERGKVTDFGALEVQAVYISGNIRRPFEFYIANPSGRKDMIWKGQTNYPRPDYLSSSRKRLAPQLLFKGGILNAWRKKIAVALNKGFFDTLPPLEEVKESDADIAWLIYELQFNISQGRHDLALTKTVHTRFDTSLSRITRSDPGEEQEFVAKLQDRLDEKLENGTPPDAPTIELDL